MIEIKVGHQVDFANYCPVLRKQPAERPVGFFFDCEQEGLIASEVSCPNGGLPGVEKRSDSGFLIHINPDRIVAYCNGCTKLPQGFEKLLETLREA